MATCKGTALCLILCVAFVPACGGAEGNAGEEAADGEGSPVTVTDADGEEVTVEDANRIVPLNGDIAEIV